MLFQSKSHPGWVLAMLTAMIAVLCTFASLAAAQDQPAPKWELYGGYSFFQPGTDVRGQLPGALLPVGDHRLMPDAFHDVDKLGFLLGGGVDFNLSRHVALRLIKADYAFSNCQYGASSVTPRAEIRGLRLQVGLNFMFGGGAPPVSPGAACSVQPAKVFAGEPVTATASGSNFNPTSTVKHDWNGAIIIAQSGISFSTAGNLAVTTLNGRALSPIASVTMVSTVIKVA